MVRRDPHDVLGVPRDASPATIKAAWRRLAREHHPDLATADPAAARRATRQMAEINAAYEELRDAGGAAGRAPGRNGFGTPPVRKRAPTGSNVRTKAHAPGGPPRPRPERPVTGRVDMSGTLHQQPAQETRRGPSVGRANAGTYRPPTGAYRPATGAYRPPDWRGEPEPLRASDPTGPLHLRRDGEGPVPLPPLDEALETRIEFGKFHGHTLGEIAAFEPSYIDWLAHTITRDRTLVLSARAIRNDLDARGVRRLSRAERVAPPPPEPCD